MTRSHLLASRRLPIPRPSSRSPGRSWPRSRGIDVRGGDPVVIVRWDVRGVEVDTGDKVRARTVVESGEHAAAQVMALEAPASVQATD